MRSRIPGKEAIQQGTERDFRASSRLSAWSVSSKTLGQSQNTRKVSALKTQAVFKLQRHSHQSFYEMNFFYSNVENDSISIPLSLQLNDLALLITLALFLCFEVN